MNALILALALPACWPGLENDDYVGTWFIYAEGPTCRWVRYWCEPKGDKLARVITISGSKTIPATTLLGRMLTLEQSKDRETSMRLMWRAYVGEPDPVCTAEANAK